MNNGQKNEFHQSTFLQLNRVVRAAAFSDSRQGRTEGSLSKMCAGGEGAIGISALEQETMSFVESPIAFMKL